MMAALLALGTAGCGTLGGGTATPTPALATYAAPVDSLRVQVTPGDPPKVEAILRGMFAESCAWVGGTKVERTEQTFHITVYAETYADRGCAPATEPYETTVLLDVRGLPAGEYTVKAGEAQAAFTLGTTGP
jgi:inhibitor of cysteine peptidase